MALTLKILGAGTLTTTHTPLYPPSGTAIPKNTLVTNIILVNRDASTVATIKLTVKQGTGSEPQICPLDLQLPPKQAFVFDDELTLNAANPDVLKGSATGSSTVDYVVNGVERDV